MPMGDTAVSAFRPQTKSKADLIKESTLTLGIWSVAEQINFTTENPCESLVLKKVFRFSRALK